MINNLDNKWCVAAFTIRNQDSDPFKIEVSGRNRWALEALWQAHSYGCSPIEVPAPRWSSYVFQLRGLGVDIATIMEAHGEPFSGNHARYVLRSTVLSRHIYGLQSVPW